MAKPVKKKNNKMKIKPKKQLNRKELRKQKILQKKENKRIFFTNKNSVKEEVKQTLGGKTAGAQLSKNPKKEVKAKEKTFKKSKPTTMPENMSIEDLLSGAFDPNNDDSISSDFSDEEVNARIPASMRTRQEEQQKQQLVKKCEPPAKKVKVHIPARPDAAELHRRELQQEKELQNASKKNRIKQLLAENEEEDKLINQLEKKLKMNKSKDKNRLVRKMFNDGLDYALELCLDDEEEQEKRQLKEKRKKQQEQQIDSSWSDNEDEADEMTDEDGQDDEEMDEQDDDDDDAVENSIDEKENSDHEEHQNTFTEDIYGRKRDKHGNIITEKPAPSSDSNVSQKYIPPHQRALLAAQGDAKQAQVMEQLRRNCKGQLNRLSEANLHKICTGIEELYMKNSRYNMNETLAALLNEALISRTIANERMVQEHMVLLAYLHAQVGSEIGAHFLQLFIEQFMKFIEDLHKLTVEDKRFNNLVLVLAYMYIFKIYEHRLLLEIITKLADNLCEKSIECMLLIFQSVGFKLRKDDPLAFKQMLLDVQQKIAAAPLEMKENLRLKFMVDILNAVKNNNINKIPHFDPELAENLRKRLKSMLRNDKYVITLNIAMDDLLRADQVGKWWVVGSAWSGNITDLGSANKQKSKEESGQRFSEQLLKLAKAQKMNTEERRNIFCIIMGAEDYVDAFEKILHLALKDQRTIAYVIMHCCLSEKRANPYYAHLALKFCNYNRKFQLAFQFAAWDRINDIQRLGKQQVRNLAAFLQQLITNGGLALSVLKVVNFLQLDKLSLLLMKDIMVGVLLGNDDNDVYQVFERVAKNVKLNQFKSNIRLFIQLFLLKQEEREKLKLSETEFQLLQKRAENVDTILAYVDL